MALALGLFAVPQLAGCESPCDQIAGIACEVAGEASEECTRLRDKAGRASADDKEACTVALEVYESLEKVR